MTRLPRVTADEVLRALQRDGWYVARSTRHRILKHPTKPGSIPVPYHQGRTVKVGTLSNIITLAGLSVDEFVALL